MKDKSKKIIGATALGLAFTALGGTALGVGAHAYNLQNELNSTKEILQNSHDSFMQVFNDLSDAKQTIKDLERENLNLKASLATSNLQIKDLSQKIEQSRKDKENLRALFKTQQDEFMLSEDEFNKQIATLSSKLKLLSMDFDELIAEHDKLQAKNNELNQDYKDSLNRIIEMTHKISLLEAKLYSGEISLANANAEVSELQEELNQTKAERDDLKQKHDILKDHLSGDTVAIIENEISALNTYIDSDNERNADDRNYVHSIVNDLMTRTEIMYALGNATIEEYELLMLKLDMINDQYIFANIVDTVNTVMACGAVEMRLISDEHKQLAAYTQEKAYSYGLVKGYVDPETGIIDQTKYSNFHAVITEDNVSEQSVEGVYTSSEGFDAYDVLSESMSGMLSELGDALDGATEVNYDSESDTYSVSTTNDTYGKVTYSYDIENNTLNNYSLESNEGNVYIEFKELEKEEFEETYRAIYSTVQKAKENSTTETNEK